MVAIFITMYKKSRHTEREKKRKRKKKRERYKRLNKILKKKKKVTYNETNYKINLC